MIIKLSAILPDKLTKKKGLQALYLTYKYSIINLHTIVNCTFHKCCFVLAIKVSKPCRASNTKPDKALMSNSLSFTSHPLSNWLKSHKGCIFYSSKRLTIPPFVRE